MSAEQLREKLEQLKREIQRLDTADHESRDRLQALIDEIETRLQQEDTGTDEDDGLLDRVQDAITHFETNHPRATAILNDIMVTLSNMGI